jgi:hypothetical protein
VAAVDGILQVIVKFEQFVPGTNGMDKVGPQHFPFNSSAFQARGGYFLKGDFSPPLMEKPGQWIEGRRGLHL